MNHFIHVGVISPMVGGSLQVNSITKIFSIPESSNVSRRYFPKHYFWMKIRSYSSHIDYSKDRVKSFIDLNNDDTK